MLGDSNNVGMQYVSFGIFLLTKTTPSLSSDKTSTPAYLNAALNDSSFYKKGIA
jgi:hypothetical protein